MMEDGSTDDEITFTKCFDKNHNIFQTTRFNHTMIFFKLIDLYKLSDSNCLGYMLNT